MADITNLFKATVKTIKSRNKAQGLSSGPDKSILGHTKKKGEFCTGAKNVVNTISKLKEFLLEHRKEYISAGSHMASDVKMTDAQRNQIDQDTEGFIRTCSEAIKVLRNQDATGKLQPQIKEHREAMLSLLEKYLKSVIKMYSEQKAVRVKRVVDRKRISKLEPLKKRKRDDILNNMEKDSRNPDNMKNHTIDNNKKTSSPIEESPMMEDDDELSPEEAQMFEMENQQLYEEMNSMVDEVRQVEGKVVEISRLQEIFADKVLEQERDIDNIADTVVGTTENIKEANEEIREAMKNNAGLRVWILFFLIVLSFTLLFLDWYNA